MLNDKTIFQVVPSNLNSGPVNVARDLQAGLSSCGLKAMIFPLRGDKGSVIKGMLALIKCVSKDRGIILHSHGILPDLICWFISQVYRVRWVSTVHCDPLKDLGFIYKRTYKVICFFWLLLLRFSDKVVYLTEYIESKYGRSNAEVIYNCRNIPSAPNLRRFSNDRKLKIGYCGALIQRKNVLNLVKSVLSGERFELKVAGDGPLLSSLLALSENSENIEFLGHLDDLTEFWNSIDVFVLPSLAEGVPLVAIEALSRNIPLVLMKLTNYEGVFTTNECVFISEADCSDLNLALDSIIGDYSNYSDRAKVAFVSHFSFSDWILKYKETYCER
ncbi:glycosyltransferase family 4 protein [Vibrio splendidus]|uniref:glycosyltransferase family 4 protein n=1 Tax=Vibrio splendidus TaxID=29497 RepID=UPI000D39EB3A|nr:glycosyltransferase family 4 protein [Vibrio splendidus]PTO65217.1 hypothetical protein CWN99_08830 [Vibrio splendidus]